MKNSTDADTNPFVSVIIPTKNRANYLARAVFSVRNQSFKNLEIIIIDDCSDIHNQEFNKNIASLNKCRIITNNISLGGAKSRNIGIYASKGKWIAFLDDDDEWLPNKLDFQLKKLSKNCNAIAATCNYKIIKENDFFFNSKEIVTNLDHLLYKNRAGGASLCIASKAALIKISGFDERLLSAQDWDLWVRLCKIGYVESVNTSLVNYYVHQSKRISTNYYSIYKGRRRFFFKYRDSMIHSEICLHLTYLLFCRIKLHLSKFNLVNIVIFFKYSNAMQKIFFARKLLLNDNKSTFGK